MLAQNSKSIQDGLGKNIIPPPERPSLLKGYLEKFRDPLIIVLLVVFLFSVAVACYEISEGGPMSLLLEPAGVLFALLLATGVGFIFEVKAEGEFQVLNQVRDDEPVKVLRLMPDGMQQMFRIAKKDVCVGDRVSLEAGDQIPADGRIVRSNQLRVDESNFTGEPWSTKGVIDESDSEMPSDKESAYPKDFLLRGSTVIEGSAQYEVVAIGMDTEEGRGAARVQEGKEVKTPLRRQLDVLGKWISYASFVIAVLIVIGRLVYFFLNVSEPERQDPVTIIHVILSSVMIAVTLIVVAVPEGLPMSITVSLALSMRKMLKENNLVRKLHACETMGAATVICTDKTGTLTQNRMTVVESLFGADIPAEEIARSIAVNSTAELNGNQAIGNPTEGALLQWIRSRQLDYRSFRQSAAIVRQKPFSTETKYMLTQVDDTVYLKGAPEIILQMCGKLAEGLTQERILSTLEDYQSKAYRTLGFAINDTFVGLVGIADPIRPDVREAIDICMNRAHVKVIIVTGDTVGTANEIGRQIGLLAEGETDKTLTGPDFAALSDADAKKMLKEGRVKIIARARPDDKARLVVLLQRNGEVVAVTGDGTNDAPALAKAQVGLSMGDGTARAKEASDITIIDNSFVSINRAILWGRSLYQNLRRFIIFQMTINVCACLVVLLGAFTGLQSPLNVTQMLWVNLIMDTFAAMALSSLPADPRVMSEYPRSPRAHIIDRHMITYISGWGAFFFLLLTGIWEYLISHYQGKGMQIDGYHEGLFFTTFVLIQFWNLFNVRYYNTGRCLTLDLLEAVKGIRPLSATFGRGFVFIVSVILAGQILIQQVGYEMFEIEPLEATHWLLLIVGTFPVLLLPDLYRFIFRCRRERA